MIEREKTPDLKDIMGSYPETIEMNEDLIISALGENPPSDLSYNLVQEYTLVPTKIDPNKKKTSKLYPLP